MNVEEASGKELGGLPGLEEACDVETNVFVSSHKFALARREHNPVVVADGLPPPLACAA